MEKVHCMSLSSIHIHYNHSPIQAFSSLAGHCAPSVKFNWTEVVTSTEYTKSPAHSAGLNACASQTGSNEKTPSSFLARPAAKPNRGTERRAGIGQALVGRRYGHDDGSCRV